METPLRIGLIADIHYGPSANTKEGERGLELLVETLHALDQEDLALVVDLGDRLTTTGRDEDLARLRELALAFGATRHPVVHLMGNHDGYTLTAADHERELGTGWGSHVQEIDGTQLVFFNPRLDVEQRMRFVLADEDLDWLKRTIDNPSTPSLVFSHVPLYQRSLDGNFYFERAWSDGASFRNRRAIRQALEASGSVLANIAGHVHWESVATIDGLHLLTVPSLTETFQTPEEAQAGYAILTLDADRIDIEMRGRRPGRYVLPRRAKRRWINLDSPHGERPTSLTAGFRSRFEIPFGDAGGEGADRIAPTSREDETLARVGWMYYVDQMTQQEIADRMGLPRSRVIRLLQQAVYQGVVQIRINSPASDVIDLEHRLRDRFALQHVRLAPQVTAQNASAAAGKVATEVVGRLMTQDVSLAVAWGSTLLTVARELDPRASRAKRVLPTTGGLPQNSAIGPSSVVLHFAEVLQAESLLINAPMFADDPELKDRIMRSTSVGLVLDEVANADVWLVNAVDLTRLNDLQSLTFTREVIESMGKADIVGLLGGHALRSDGTVAPHPLNDRLIAPPLSVMKNIPTKILVAAGVSKAAIVHAALRSGAIDILISDTETARALLHMA